MQTDLSKSVVFVAHLSHYLSHGQGLSRCFGSIGRPSFNVPCKLSYLRKGPHETLQRYFTVVQVTISA